MPNTPFPSRFTRHALLTGTSVFALLLSLNGAHAGALSQAGANIGATVASTQAAAIANAQASAAAAQRSQQSLAQAAAALKAMQAAQAAAHALAAASASAIPNGLGNGALDPVSNPNSTTDGLTDWIGANAPTQTVTGGHYDVTVKQTQPKAILSWNSFNVGKDTTLTYDQQGNADWIALNRVVGAAAAPSQILGSIKADGTVLVINQNGIVFGGTAQVNVHSLIASTLDVGIFSDPNSSQPYTVAQRNADFLTYGLLGLRDKVNTTQVNVSIQATFSGQKTGSVSSRTFAATGKVDVDAGANIITENGGYILLTAPWVSNSGTLSATDGQVILAAGDGLVLVRATGATDSVDSGLRGFIPYVAVGDTTLARGVQNDGIISSPRGSIFVGVGSNQQSPDKSVALVNGTLYATTSVSRNGAIEISGSTIDIAAGARLAILPDNSGETIPQDATSISNFQPSQIYIGDLNSRNASSPLMEPSVINIESDSLIYAPSGNITIGAASGLLTRQSNSDLSRVVINSGAVIDAGGLTGVTVPVSAQQITIHPVKKNELADSPLYRDGFLNGATVTVDPTLSGVRDDGVAWIGSPLIDAKSYYEQVGVSVQQLMTKGGNVTVGSAFFANAVSDGQGGTVTLPVSQTPYVVVKSGALINVSGGWLSYAQGSIKTTKLVDIYGRVVDIGKADVNDTYVGLFKGISVTHPRWGIVEYYSTPMLDRAGPVGGYIEGRDAGAVTLVAPTGAFEGTIMADTVTGVRQRLDAEAGTATSSLYGDSRKLQGASSQLPSGGAFIVQGLGAITTTPGPAQACYEGASIRIVSGQDYQPVSGRLGFGQTVTSNPDGTLGVSARDASSYLDPSRIGTIFLSDRLLSNAGLSEVGLSTSGSVTVTAGAEVGLAAGGVFDVFSGHQITIDGLVSVPSGTITLETFDSQLIPKVGYSSETYGVGSFDIAVNGTLSTRGQWVNDFGNTGNAVQGTAWLDGGTITLYSAPRVVPGDTVVGVVPPVTTDISGSIRLNAGATLDVSGGGYVDPAGKLVLTAKGGNLGLYNTTTYFQLQPVTDITFAGALEAFRISPLYYAGDMFNTYLPLNPDKITSGVFIDPAATIKAHGFGGGGTFTLVTPEFAFSDDTASTAGPNATRLPLDFFSKAGFGNYSITSYKTRIVQSNFEYQLNIIPRTYLPSSDTVYVNDGYRWEPITYNSSNETYSYNDYYMGPQSFTKSQFSSFASHNSLRDSSNPYNYNLIYDPTYGSEAGGFYYTGQPVLTTITPGGTDAVLDTQTLTVGRGQTLNLTQSMFTTHPNAAQAASLRTLATGGDLYSILTPAVPDNAWDAKAVNLTLGGLLELHVAQGGSVTGAASANLTVAKLLNDGTIRLPGGTLTQQLLLPSFYQPGTSPTATVVPLGIRNYSDIFSIDSDGTISSSATSTYSSSLTNGQILGVGIGGSSSEYPIYFVGLLDADQGVVLSSGSVTDLSGTSIRNPYSQDPATGQMGITGRIVSGGSLITSPRVGLNQTLFQLPRLNALGGAYGQLVEQQNGVGLFASQSGDSLTIRDGATLNLSGASDTYLIQGSAQSPLRQARGLAPQAVWSDAGTLSAGASFTIGGGANILAFGGVPDARDGTLSLFDPVLIQTDPSQPIAGQISVDTIRKSGFDTLVAVGSLSSSGDATLSLGRALFVTSRAYVLDGMATYAKASLSQNDSIVPTLKSGGRLVVNAAYIGLSSTMDILQNPAVGTAGQGSLTLNAGSIDITGAVLFDKSVATATLNATGDVRLIGALPWQTTYGAPTSAQTLNGALAVNGDLTVNAGQIYPTSGSNFVVASTKTGGTITFGRSGSVRPAAPYSAGANLTIAAANIVQGGVLEVPFGTLTLGTKSDYYGLSGIYRYAPATASLTLAAGGITSVSGNGLSIPYGTTTDTIEWYFSPTNGLALTQAPAKQLVLNGTNIAVTAGAGVDLSGGGDIYAYEFVPGTGGSRDVLDRLNADAYTGNNGYQYSDGRQVYAIVPGLSSAQAAAIDPIYSSGYGSLYAPSGVGKRVYLSAAPGLAAGWYTLLPAKYAMLPGGMAVVEQTGAGNVTLGVSSVQPDGALYVSGYYGDALTGASSSAVSLFRVLPQATVTAYSDIVLTSGNSYFTKLATDKGLVRGRLPVDAGYLQINAAASLVIDSILSTAAGTGGRGATVDIAGSKIAIVASDSQAIAGDGALYVTAGALSNLNAASLLVGGLRTDNSDGTTAINVTAQTVRVFNDASAPFTAGEIVLAATGSVKVDDGSVLTAKGTLTDTRQGAYQIGSATVPGSGTGALLRLANGPQRLVSRTNAANTASLSVGRAQFNGAALLFDSSGANVISAAIGLAGIENLAISAPRIGIGVDPATYAGTIASTALVDMLGRAGAVLTLRSQSAIDIAAGSYSFGKLALDAHTLASVGNGSATIDADVITFGNSGSSADCTDCAAGSGSLTLSANEILFTGGAVTTKATVTPVTQIGFFSGGVTLAATNGIFAQGTGGQLDTGTGALTLHTPYLGDNVAGVTSPSAPGLALKTLGALTIDNDGAGPVAEVAAIPGGTLSLEGASVSISGATVNLTAGKLSITATNGISLSNGAIVRAASYSKTFGDAADPVEESAPRGMLTLWSKQGSIGLDAGTLVSVGGQSGAGGSLQLLASNGTVAFGGTIDGAAPGGGASFALDTGGAFDLALLGGVAGNRGFTGDISIHTRSGNLTLAQGQSLKATSLSLTGDGGAVSIAGSIDTSGINGGAVTLYGAQGVALASSAVIDAHANGYGISDTRQAKAGDVTLGTSGGGAVTMAAGALIDLSARETANRLVPYYTNNVKNYLFVAGDLGGRLILRAPVVASGGGDTVNVAVADATGVRGAREIDLVGVKTWDLGALGSVAGSGVTVNTATNTAVIDPTGTYFSSAAQAGGIVPFIQNFDISASYGNLGGLASSAAFHAKPGVDLAFDGNVEMDRNWNLAAGSVDVAGATAAGLMKSETYPGSGGASVTQSYVVAGREADLFTGYVTMLYRTDHGSVGGEAPVIALEATGNLAINASISDGFFQFRDQTNPDYLVAVAAGGSTALYAPYSVAGNSVSPDKSGDPFGSAVLFPALGAGRFADSASIDLVAGAGSLTGANPAAVDPNAINALLSVAGYYTYSYSGNIGYQGQFPVTAPVQSLIRTGVGSIDLVSGGTVDLTGGQSVLLTTWGGSGPNGQAMSKPVGGVAVYTAGHVADLSARSALDVETGQTVTVDPSALLRTGTIFASTRPTYDGVATHLYGYGIAPSVGSYDAPWATGAVGVLIADGVYAEGGGDVAITAGGDVLARRDQWLQGNLQSETSSTLPWAGAGDEPWRVGATGANTWAQIDYQLFRGGVGALGGGDITIRSGGAVTDLSVIATASLTTATAGGAKTLMTFGRGDATVIAGGAVSGLMLDVASGTGLVRTGGGIAAAGGDQTLVKLTDATISLEAYGTVTLDGIRGLGATPLGTGTDVAATFNGVNAFSFYLPNSGISVLSDGAVSLGTSYLLPTGSGVNLSANVALPGSLSLISLNDSLLFAGSDGSQEYIMMPSPKGELQLLAGGSILVPDSPGSAYLNAQSPMMLAMLDADPGVLPGIFSTPISQEALEFPNVAANITDQQRALFYRAQATHAGDDEPVRIYAGQDIGATYSGVKLFLPKQARLSAGRDIVNTIFYGQNIASTDITRVVAGRDIIGTSILTSMSRGPNLPTLIGNTWVIGGPGDFVIEAGRDLGPFMPSVIVNGTTSTGASTKLTYGNGILSLGNELNPYLPAQGADLSVMFGVGNGENYTGFRDYYLNPANFAQLPDGLRTSGGDSIYGDELIAWMRTHWSAALPQGDVTYAQAYAAFTALPEVTQRLFLDKVYFAELEAPAIPNGVSYQKYSRGYEAVNLLFPASYGYTENSLEGGANGVSTMVQTGDLDLRLATIQTARGGDISILGPGGRVLAGSVVRTAAQAARRNYADFSTSRASFYAVQSIPTGFEGVLTLRGGSISTFTDGDFLLNQSRLFTEQGGDILMWSSNADLNAGQGPKTSANYPPVLVRVSSTGYVELDQVGATTGAGIAALQATPDTPPSDVYLLAPRGTVDAGDAGVRVSGNISVVALRVLNADNIQVGGQSFGVPLAVAPSVNTGALAAGNAAGAASAAAEDATRNSRQTGPRHSDMPSIITVEVIGYGGAGDSASPDQQQQRQEQERQRRLREQHGYDTTSPFQIVGAGNLNELGERELTKEEKQKLHQQ